MTRRHWCDICLGFTGPDSPCYDGPDEDEDDDPDEARQRQEDARMDAYELDRSDT